MSEGNKSDSSTSDSEVCATSENYNPMKALYSSKSIIPDKKAPMFNTIQQFENAQTYSHIEPVHHGDIVAKREEDKKQAKLAAEQELIEKNKARFSQYEGLTTVPRREFKSKNLLTRIPKFEGPLAVLKDCVDNDIKVKVVTRHGHGIRGYVVGILVAFDKQWNLALKNVLEVWKRKCVKKRKMVPALGEPVPQGTAALISPVPAVIETPLGGGYWECTRHIPQLVVRGEHVVTITIIER